MIGLALALLQITETPSLDEMYKQDPWITTYYACVMKKARDFEVGGDAAESVAKVAVMACDQAGELAVLVHAAKAEANLRRNGSRAFTEEERTELKSAIRDRLHQDASKLALASVVTKRSAR